MNRLETTNQRNQLKTNSTLQTNGRWRAMRGWELMVELSVCGSANGKWEVIKEKRLMCGSPTVRRAGLPIASFIIICLAGGSESGQTEQPPSFFSLSHPLSCSSLSFVIFFHCYLSYILPSISHSLHPVHILFHLFFQCFLIPGHQILLLSHAPLASHPPFNICVQRAKPFRHKAFRTHA